MELDQSLRQPMLRSPFSLQARATRALHPDMRGHAYARAELRLSFP